MYGLPWVKEREAESKKGRQFKVNAGKLIHHYTS